MAADRKSADYDREDSDALQIRYFQKGFNYSQDGAGNRLVYHLQGCNLSCPWCSNPEGMAFEGGISLSVAALVQEALRCRPMFFDGGGVTFTGGECTCQFAPLKEALVQLQAAGISTALETNGTSPRLPELFPLLDQLIIDCKHWDPEVHRRFTGMDNRQGFSNLRAAFARHPRVLVRIPLIGGFNAGEEDMRSFADFFTGATPGNACFELLLYHEYGKDKWEKTGRPYTMKNAFVSEETRRSHEQYLRSRGLQVIRT